MKRGGMWLLFAIDSLGSGGAQRQIVSLAVGLARRGHTPVFCVYYPEHDHFADELTSAGIEIRRTSKRSRFSLAPALAMRRMLRIERFDAVVAFLPTPGFYALLATRYRGHPPLVVSERSTFEEEPPRFSARLRMHLVRFVDLVVTNSHHHRESMTRLFPWTAERTRTIWNGVDLDRFAPREAYQDRADLDTLVAIASIRPLKNARALAQALVLLKERGRAVPRIRWAGKLEPTNASAHERAAVDALLGSAGLSDRWEWLGELSDISGLLRSHAALIHPSVFEGLPNAVCEALASGLPVLAGRIGDQPRLVQHGVSGMIFDPRAPESIAATIDEFFRRGLSDRVAMSVAARSFAERTLALGRVYDEYETILRSLVAGARRGTSRLPDPDPLSLPERQ